jgi:hypothetical protein
MNTSVNQAGLTCSICGNSTQQILDLPNLPLTGRYSKEVVTEIPAGIDQEFLYCQNCMHGKLRNIVDPAELYASSYYFRTSDSNHSMAGSEFFLESLAELTDGKKFNCIVDVGCNDLYLLNKMKGQSKYRVGIDPIWEGKEDEVDEEGLSVIGTVVEDSVIASKFPDAPDLIILRHTIEHLPDPVKALEAIMEFASDDCYIAIETPGIETLLARSRFDQIFHQHLQYFSINSFHTLADNIGADVVDSRINYHFWGAIFILFTKKNQASSPNALSETLQVKSSAYVHDQFSVFKENLAVTRTAFESIPAKTAYGYGASQILPTLIYHMGLDPNILNSVLDDDPAKDGLFYWNLPIQIKVPDEHTDIRNAKVMITAIDHTRAIMRTLATKNPPKDIVIPAVTF